jgi:hypothetical protein
MPCPQPLGPLYRIELKPNNLFLLFLASHQPSEEGSPNSLPLAQPHPRNISSLRAATTAHKLHFVPLASGRRLSAFNFQ